jgi:hypothetical protein
VLIDQGKGGLFSHSILALNGLNDILRSRAILERDVDIRDIFVNSFLPEAAI